VRAIKGATSFSSQEKRLKIGKNEKVLKIKANFKRGRV
jgi:hypothetical protein